MTFPASTIHSFREGWRRGGSPRMGVLFLGLFGPHGPMPGHLTPLAQETFPDPDEPASSRASPLAAFCDLFHHRVLMLFYRAWASARPTNWFDRPEEDRFAMFAAALIGIGMPTLRHRDSMPDLAKLRFAGRLSSQSRSAPGLAEMLRTVCEMPAQVEQFVGQWVDLPSELICRLGAPNGRLGESISIGSSVWLVHHKFRIVLGPLGRLQFESALPGGSMLAVLTSIVRNYIGDELDWDVQLVLRKDEVPRLALGGTTRLGWTTWLWSVPHEEDPRDVVLASL